MGGVRFDPNLFSAELAALFDGLQRVRDMDCAAPATTARGWEAACALAAHFLDRDTLMMGVNTPAQDAALAALLWALLPGYPIGLSTAHVCAMLLRCRARA